MDEATALYSRREFFLVSLREKNVRHRNLQVSQILSENLKKILEKSIENQKKKIYFDIEPMLLLAPIGAQTVEPLVLHAEAAVLHAEAVLLRAEAMVLQLK